MSEITEERINKLKVSIHRLRVFLNYTNSMKQKESKDHKSKSNSFDSNRGKLNYKNEIKQPLSIKNKNAKEKIRPSVDNKIKALPGECVVEQGQKGSTAFLILSGSFNVEIDKKVIGSMSAGEIFGELSLILGEERKATVRAITGSELVEINTSFLDDYLLSSKTTEEEQDPLVLETQKAIKQLSVELGKKNNQKIPIKIEKLKNIISDQSNLVQALSLQLHKRLAKMIREKERENKIKDVE